MSTIQKDRSVRQVVSICNKKALDNGGIKRKVDASVYPDIESRYGSPLISEEDGE
jgi:hypothetical protein